MKSLINLLFYFCNLVKNKYLFVSCSRYFGSCVVNRISSVNTQQRARAKHTSAGGDGKVHQSSKPNFGHWALGIARQSPTTHRKHGPADGEHGLQIARRLTRIGPDRTTSQRAIRPLRCPPSFSHGGCLLHSRRRLSCWQERRGDQAYSSTQIVMKNFHRLVDSLRQLDNIEHTQVAPCSDSRTAVPPGLPRTATLSLSLGIPVQGLLRHVAGTPSARVAMLHH
ncbi:uncharacterized protein LOC111362837 [Spodoptera litura]|uniref:Uncharacterized protein LOC111362837 n=1 Tax=Spodoptera litura TaxID=69820 RepID=A0A9J7EUX2_SPOLT|nr:uncharacterized protein LOC111362837 [Spodoptera litura]